ncbi:Carbon-nitrogen hydrolase [Didymosphaeria variabile]|uniref:Carbon-nitrogen hydrolase n=1 Tax=Didymosphaeria variabile TaxID=1932322 RepID=A0A9W8XKV4_9PLEO|nr:Carbon-nitrogen hydrolase [Didymosphaeria variabile]KAJ4353324.1 Carbon-nitrogen hydrolase [Didymosphaeria variabile]
MTHNLSQCTTLIQKASAAGAKALFLPEASDYIASGKASETVSLAKPVETSEFVIGIQEQAKKQKLPVNVGVHEPTASGGKVKNTLLWIDAEGQITHRYQKLHLFDVEIKDGPILKESNGVERGSRIEDPVDTPVGKVAHWETLLRARAIETQSYVIAAAQVGCHNEERTRRSYGHSMIVDPWGKVLAELGGEEDEKGRGLDVGEIALAEIDLEYLEKVRREVPLLRRTDVYPEFA